MKIWEHGTSSAIENKVHHTGSAILHGFVICGGGAAGVLAGAVSILDDTTVIMTWPIGTPSAALICMGLDLNIGTALETTLTHADDQILVLYRGTAVT